MGDELETIRQYSSVKLWIERTTDSSLRPARDWEKRLGHLRGFCEASGTDPDTMIKESVADTRAKNDHMRNLKQWCSTLPGNDRDRHEAENMIRHFFMKNGMRMMVKPFADVYRRSPNPGA